MIESDGERQVPVHIEDTEPSHLIRYQFTLRYVSPQFVILDAPCGSGYGTALIASTGAKVFGVDIHEGAIQHAKEFFSLPSSSFHVGNIENLLDLFTQDGSLDLIVSFEGIEHLNHPESFLRESRRLLKPDGRLIISTPRKPHGSPYHIKEYSLEEYRRELETYFRINRMFGQIFTDIFELFERNVDPFAYKRFNFIADCSPK